MVLGTDTHDFSFKDDETGRTVNITMSFIDGIHLKLLERIAGELKRLKR